MHEIAGTGLGWSKVLGIQFRSSTWVSGTQLLEPSLLPRIYPSCNLESEGRTRYQAQDSRVVWRHLNWSLSPSPSNRQLRSTEDYGWILIQTKLWLCKIHERREHTGKNRWGHSENLATFKPKRKASVGK